MPYVSHRWLGGLLTNWRTISDRIDRLHDLRRQKEEGQLDLLPAKERIAMLAELEKLDANLGGVADLRRQPDAVFIIDLRKEQLAVREARRLGLAVIALVDTNCDPDESDYAIPGNDDAIRACSLIARVIADGSRRARTRCRCRSSRRARAGRRSPSHRGARAGRRARGRSRAAEPLPPSRSPRTLPRGAGSRAGAQPRRKRPISPQEVTAE